jgi:hypothetical protein
MRHLHNRQRSVVSSRQWKQRRGCNGRVEVREMLACGWVTGLLSLVGRERAAGAHLASAQLDSVRVSLASARTKYDGRMLVSPECSPAPGSRLHNHTKIPRDGRLPIYDDDIYCPHGNQPRRPRRCNCRCDIAERSTRHFQRFSGCAP